MVYRHISRNMRLAYITWSSPENCLGIQSTGTTASPIIIISSSSSSSSSLWSLVNTQWKTTDQIIVHQQPIITFNNYTTAYNDGRLWQKSAMKFFFVCVSWATRWPTFDRPVTQLVSSSCLGLVFQWINNGMWRWVRRLQHALTTEPEYKNYTPKK